MAEPGGFVTYAGLDWATDKHDVCLVDPAGRVVAEACFKANAEGLAELGDWLALQGGGDAGSVAVGLEVPHGPVVELLMERGFAVHSINPKQLDRFRDRFTVAGAKDDRRDARALADSLRTDSRAFRHLSPEEPEIVVLREWSRTRADLQEERTRLCNRMRAQLRRYYPQVLELSEDIGEAWFLALLETAPTPARARGLRQPTVERLLKEHRIRRWSATDVLKVLRGPTVQVAAGTIDAASGSVEMLCEKLRLVNNQLARCNRTLDSLCDSLGRSDEGDAGGRENEPRDVEILRSLPGVGRIIAATLLAEASRPLREGDYQALRTLSGVAPVTRRSGKSRVVSMRKACNPRLREAIYHWARVAVQNDPVARARYRALRARGKSHGHACRVVGDALLRTCIAMLEHRTLYDPARPRQVTAA